MAHPGHVACMRAIILEIATNCSSFLRRFFHVSVFFGSATTCVYLPINLSITRETGFAGDVLWVWVGVLGAVAQRLHVAIW